MRKIYFFFVTTIVLAFSSCNMLGDLQIEKRHYGKGYYVHVRDNRKAVEVIDNENATVANNETARSEKSVAPENLSVENNSASPVPPNELAKDQNPAKSSSVLIPVENETINSKKNEEANINAPEKKPSPQPSGDVNQIILVILALIISPLAVYLKEGVTVRFWLDLIAWLLGVGIVGFYFYGGGFLLFAIVFALLIIFDII